MALKHQTLPRELQENFDQLEKLINAKPDFSGVRRKLMQGNGIFASGTSVGTRLFGGANLELGNRASPAMLFYLDPAEWALTGKTPKLRLRGTAQSNATAPGATCTFQYGLYPVTATAGGAGGITYTLGAAVTGSAISFSAPFPASTRDRVETADFDMPSAGYYALGIALGGAATAASSYMNFSAHLFLRYV